MKSHIVSLRRNEATEAIFFAANKIASLPRNDTIWTVMMADKKYIWQRFDFSGDSLDLLGLFHDEPHVFFLDSSQQDPHRGRYSFIGFDPFDVFIHQGEDTLNLLKEKFTRYAETSTGGFSSPFSPLTAGMVGCLGYDYGLRQEKIRIQSDEDLNLPDCFFGFYDCILTVDHFTRKLYVTSSGLPEKNQLLREKRARRRMSEILNRLDGRFNRSEINRQDTLPGALGGQLSFECNFSKQRYLDTVRKALEYIRCGDIYQVNLSQRFQFEFDGDLRDSLRLYSALRDISPSPFGGYMDCGNFRLISNSPERFLHLNNGIVQARPMKGTQPRGDDERHDRILRKALLDSPKEKAELLMITDLLRNDLGRVCEYGSVAVKEMRTLEEYPYVFQTTAMVEGALNKGNDWFALMNACFPGGSVTGCPKIRAMEIIEELEPTRRGMYTGSLGYINFAGNMDFNILIRTLLAYRGKLYFQVGGGIVADSTPENEYNETLVKARALRTCLEAHFCQRDSDLASNINV